jgi:hypothetical protein
MFVTMLERRCCGGYESDDCGNMRSSWTNRQAAQRPAARRVEYFKCKGGGFMRVVGDFFADGGNSFWENEEFEEASSHTFDPGPEELRAAWRLPDAAAQNNIPLLLFLNLPEAQ